jgi:hypothetical protein
MGLADGQLPTAAPEVPAAGQLPARDNLWRGGWILARRGCGSRRGQLPPGAAMEEQETRPVVEVPPGGRPDDDNGCRWW